MELTKESISKIVNEVVGGALVAYKEETAAREKEIQAQGGGYFKHMASAIAEQIKATTAPPEVGRVLSRTIQCLVVGKGDLERAIKLAPQRYGEAAAAEVVAFMKAGEACGDGLKVKALGSNVFTAGGVLAPGGQTNEIIELLRPQSVVRASNPTTVPLDQGTLPIPRLAGGATATYQGENLERNASEPNLDDVMLSAKELGVIVPMSNKLLAVASTDIDSMVRNDAIAAIGTREDLAFLVGDGTQNTPRGIYYWTLPANISATAHANTLDGITNGITFLLNALLSNNVTLRRPGWVWHPTVQIRLQTIRDSNGHYVFRDEMAQGKFWGIPFRSTTQIGAGYVMLADFADVIIGQMSTLTIEASTQAAYKNSSGTLVSAFSLNQTVVRLTENHDIALRHNVSAAFLNNVVWS